MQKLTITVMLALVATVGCSKKEPESTAAAPSPAPAAESAPAPAAPPAPAPAPAAAATPPATEAAASASASTAAAGAGGSGQSIYAATCVACHGTGIAGAPKLGDKADWGPRIAQGVDVLHQHAIAGFTGKKGTMPPKGGNTTLPDADVKAAVDYMVSQAR